MNKLLEVIIAHANEIRAPKHYQDRALKRYQACIECEFYKKDFLKIEYCSKCHCRIKAKIFSPKNAKACPAGKWQE